MRDRAAAQHGANCSYLQCCYYRVECRVFCAGKKLLQLSQFFLDNQQTPDYQPKQQELDFLIENRTDSDITNEWVLL